MSAVSDLCSRHQDHARSKDLCLASLHHSEMDPRVWARAGIQVCRDRGLETSYNICEYHIRLIILFNDKDQAYIIIFSSVVNQNPPTLKIIMLHHV